MIQIEEQKEESKSSKESDDFSFRKQDEVEVKPLQKIDNKLYNEMAERRNRFKGKFRFEQIAEENEESVESASAGDDSSEVEMPLDLDNVTKEEIKKKRREQKLPLNRLQFNGYRMHLRNESFSAIN